MQHPNLYIIAGPNGAGKTTASYTLLPQANNIEVLETKMWNLLMQKI